MVPCNFIVVSNIVKSSIFASERVNVLKHLSTEYREDIPILNFDDYSDEYIALGIHEFSVIHIKILDTTGNIIMLRSNTPTRLQLTMMNT